MVEIAQLTWDIKPVSASALLSSLFELAMGTGVEAPGSQGAKVVMVRSLCMLEVSPPLNLPPPPDSCLCQPSKPSST